MLTDNNATQGLLDVRKPSNIADADRVTDARINNQRIESGINRQTATSKRKNKKPNSQFTAVLKVFNIIVGIIVVAFAVACYYFSFNKSSTKKKLDLMELILPGYIGVSGLLILLIECKIGFIIRNMRFLYNYFGRGLFNIYVGVMPLNLIRDGQDTTFQVLVYVMVSLMCLIGVLYIMAKVLCCAKESENRKKRRSVDSDSSDSD